jgi:N-carbamoylputrescine amidase
MAYTERIVQIGLVQQRASANAATGLARAIEGVRAAAAKGAQIVCLQELFQGPYFCQTEDHRFFDLAEAIPGPSTDALGRVAA